jgi:NADPH2:quinone reductase
VGQLLVGWLKAIGATVIGVAGGARKAASVRQAGADHVIDHHTQDIAAEVRRVAPEGVPVVLDGVGKATWQAALDSTARRGLIVSFGSASGAVDGLALATLAAKGSLFVTRPTLFDYAATPEEKQGAVDRVFEMLAKGAIQPQVGQTFALKDAAEAHRAIEASETHGATVLLP